MCEQLHLYITACPHATHMHPPVHCQTMLQTKQHSARIDTAENEMATNNVGVGEHLFGAKESASLAADVGYCVRAEWPHKLRKFRR